MQLLHELLRVCDHLLQVAKNGVILLSDVLVQVIDLVDLFLVFFLYAEVLDLNHSIDDMHEVLNCAVDQVFNFANVDDVELYLS